MSKLTYTVIIEKGKKNYGAYAPDLPGCVAVGDTVDEAITEMAGAMELHLEGLRAEGYEIPKPSIVWHTEITVELPAA